MSLERSDVLAGTHIQGGPKNGTPVLFLR